MKDLGYEDRLHRLLFFTLEKRHLRGYDYFVKYIKGDFSNNNKLFTARPLKGTCDHAFRLEERRFNCRLQKGFFTVRVVKNLKLPSLGCSTS